MNPRRTHYVANKWRMEVEGMGRVGVPPYFPLWAPLPTPYPTLFKNHSLSSKALPWGCLSRFYTIKA